MASRPIDRSSAAAPSPAQLSQAGVADAEMVSDLVDDRLANLPLHVLRRRTRLADRLHEDGDPVGHGGRVPAPFGQGNTLIETEQPSRRTGVVHLDHHVVHGGAQLLWNVV